MFAGGNCELKVTDMNKGGKKGHVENGDSQGNCTVVPFTGNSLWKLC